MEKSGKHNPEDKFDVILCKQEFHGIGTDCHHEIIPHVAEAHEVEAVCHKKEKRHHEPIRIVEQPLDKEQAREESHDRKHNPVIVISEQALQNLHQRLETDFIGDCRIPAHDMQKMIPVDPVVVPDADPQGGQGEQNHKNPCQEHPVQHGLPVPGARLSSVI